MQAIICPGGRWIWESLTVFTELKMDERPNTFDLSTKKNFEIIASNDEDFENYRLLASQGDSPYGKTAVYYGIMRKNSVMSRVRKKHNQSHVYQRNPHL